MLGWYYGAMSAIDVLFQSHSFNTDHIFTFSLITFDISVSFLCYLYKKCIVSLPGLQHTLFSVLNQIVITKIFVIFTLCGTSKPFGD